MKRFNLLTVLLGLLFFAAFSSNAFAVYSPRLGRFLQADPGPPVASARIGSAGMPTASWQFIERDPYADGPNQYQFVGSNPINWVDPEGTSRRCTNNWFVYGVRLTLAPMGGLIPIETMRDALTPPKKPDPNFKAPKGFSLCQRNIDRDSRGGLIDTAMYNIADNTSGGHTYVSYVKDGKEEGWGIGPKHTKGQTPKPEDAFKPHSCRTCKKKCKTTPDSDIIKCIKDHEMTRDYTYGPYNNFIFGRYVCSDWAEEAAKKCGLKCE